jgi:hypothetical protein
VWHTPNSYLYQMIIPLTYKISCLLPRRPSISNRVCCHFDIIDLNPNLKVITFHFSFGFSFFFFFLVSFNHRDACFACHYCRIIKQRSMASLWHDFQGLPIVFLLVKNEIKLSPVIEWWVMTCCTLPLIIFRARV